MRTTEYLNDVILKSLLAILVMFHTLFYCFYCMVSKGLSNMKLMLKIFKKKYFLFKSCKHKHNKNITTFFPKTKQEKVAVVNT